MRINHVKIFRPDGSFENGSLLMENGVFLDVRTGDSTGYDAGRNAPHDHTPDQIIAGCDVSSDGLKDDSVLDGGGLYAVPGLIDIHLHGCMGADFCDATETSLRTILEYEASRGVTTVCPATMTLPEETLTAVMKNAARFADDNSAQTADNGTAQTVDSGTAQTAERGTAQPDVGNAASHAQRAAARFAGINLEGPFISAAKKGAQDETHIIPCDIRLFHALQQASGGRIRLVDIAPETEGAMDFIRAVSRDVRVSLAHTGADYDTAMKAFLAGARHVTHLFNAMPPFLHRAPGVAGAAFDTADCTAELISDGIHVHPAMIRAAFRLFGRDRLILISDSMRATGMKDGTYTLGGQDVTVKGNRAMLADGTLAGSVTDLAGCLRYAVLEARIPLSDALISCTMTPARAIGIDDICGSIENGKRADLVLLDDALNPVKIFVAGRIINSHYPFPACTFHHRIQ